MRGSGRGRGTRASVDDTRKKDWREYWQEDRDRRPGLGDAPSRHDHGRLRQMAFLVAGLQFAPVAALNDEEEGQQ